MKALLTSPFNPISDRLASHRSAQGIIYADMIRQSGVDLDVNIKGKITNHNDYDVMYVYHGNDWFGTLNLFGGVQNYSNVNNVKNFSQFTGRVISLSCDFPPYHDMIQQRIDAARKKNKEIDPVWLQVDLDNLKRMHLEAETVKYPHLTDKLVVGDSHAICMYRPGWTVNSVPFKTLNGVLNDGLENYIPHQNISQLQSLEFYFGNIDIRHHLCRISKDYIQNTKDLVKRYVSAVESLQVDDISIYEPLLIENESRKLPKTGYYKGQPFYGSWKQRNETRQIFADEVERLSTRTKLIRWTSGLANSLGELDFAKMEKPQSVHLSREFYPHWTGVEKQTKSSGGLQDFFL